MAIHHVSTFLKIFKNVGKKKKTFERAYRDKNMYMSSCTRFFIGKVVTKTVKKNEK